MKLNRKWYVFFGWSDSKFTAQELRFDPFPFNFYNQLALPDDHVRLLFRKALAGFGGGIFLLSSLQRLANPVITLLEFLAQVGQCVADIFAGISCLVFCTC